MNPRRNTAQASQPLPCPIILPLLAAQSLDELAPDQRELVERHLPHCAACRNARREYEALHAMLDLVARESPADLTGLLSREALSGLYAQITASPPPDVPPALQQLWDDEDRRRGTAAGGIIPSSAGATGEPPTKLLQWSEGQPDAPTSYGEGSSSPGAGAATFASSLRQPDAASWRSEASYSLEVAAQLTRAYACLKRNRTVEALAMMEPLQMARMSARQMMRLWYVMGHAYAAHSAYDKALAYLDEALVQAGLLEDLGAVAELAYLRGSVHGAIQQFAAAADDLRLALESLQALASDAESADPDFELAVLVPLASFTFVTACYDEVAGYITRARRLIRLTAGHALQAAAVEWVEALLYRWSGQPELALRNALQAAECYLQPQLAAEPLARARIFTVVADCALDVAESLPQQPHFARDRLIGLARPYAIFAVKTARDAENAQEPENETVHGLTLLTRARYDRLAGREHDRPAMIEHVVRTATHIGDKPLLAQAYTALGHEFAARGDAEPARNCYRRALDVQRTGDAVALAVWARRGLLREAEMSI